MAGRPPFGGYGQNPQQPFNPNAAEFIPFGQGQEQYSQQQGQPGFTPYMQQPLNMYTPQYMYGNAYQSPNFGQSFSQEFYPSQPQPSYYPSQPQQGAAELMESTRPAPQQKQLDIQKPKEQGKQQAPSHPSGPSVESIKDDTDVPTTPVANLNLEDNAQKTLDSNSKKPVALDLTSANTGTRSEPAIKPSDNSKPSNDKTSLANPSPNKSQKEATNTSVSQEDTGTEGDEVSVSDSATNNKGSESPSTTPQTNTNNDDEDDDDDDEEVTDLQYDENDKEHLNIIFIGHVDAGKSTIGGHIMLLTGMVDKRTMEKYEREAKEKNRESWYLSWALDTNEEERAKGKTVECGQAHFVTDKKYFTIIDAPGHKGFVPNMISGAAQADIGVLVISARKGEFETGFERGGQTREHAMLAKTAGVKYLIVVINKMDEPSVKWSEERFKECQSKLMPFLKQTGFKKEDVTFIPVSGLTGANLKEKLSRNTCSWYTGPSLIDFLDDLPRIPRLIDFPVRMPITEKYSDMGTMVMGKVHSGYIRKGQRFLLMPNKYKVLVDGIIKDDEEQSKCFAGDNVKLKLKNIDEKEISKGHVLCALRQPCSVSAVFDAQLVVLEWKSIITAGFKAVLHLHAAQEDVTLNKIVCLIDKKTNRPDKTKGRPRFVKQGDVCIVRLDCSQPVCVETFKELPDMGRFTLRDEGITVAIGKVLKLIH
eukprot:gene1164-4382_t